MKTVIRKLSFLALVLALTISLASCANIQLKWDSLSPDQQGRIVTSGVQKQIDNLFATGKAYVTANPAYTDTWKTKAIPAFDVANKALGKYINLAKTGKPMTPDAVYAEMTPLIAAITTALLQMGAIK